MGLLPPEVKHKDSRYSHQEMARAPNPEHAHRPLCHTSRCLHPGVPRSVWSQTHREEPAWFLSPSPPWGGAWADVSYALGS